MGFPEEKNGTTAVSRVNPEKQGLKHGVSRREEWNDCGLKGESRKTRIETTVSLDYDLTH